MQLNKVQLIKSMLLTTLLVPQAHAFSIQESIKIAFERNPRTQSNDIRVKAMHERTKAAWAAFLPTLSTSYSISKSQAETRMGPVTAGSDSVSRSLNVSVGFNLYDGGATLYSARAAAASAKAQEAQYNSTNALLLNTRGSIATTVFTAYTAVLKSREEEIFYGKLRKALDKILTAAQTPEDIALVQGALQSLEAAASNSDYQKESSARDFEYVVKMPVPSKLDSYDEAIASLQIPENASSAIDKALEKSPELKVAAFQLESMQLNYKAQKASTLHPRVSVGLSKAIGTSSSADDPARHSSGTTATVNVTWTFSSKIRHLNRAAELDVEAAQKTRDGELDDLKHKLESTYPTLANVTNLAKLFERNLETSSKNLNEFLAKVDAGEKGKIEYAARLVESVMSNWTQTMLMKQSVLLTKFQIQKTVGTLFEEVEATTLKQAPVQ